VSIKEPPKLNPIKNKGRMPSLKARKSNKSWMSSEAEEAFLGPPDYPKPDRSSK
jgi:hypothetical protein